MSDVALPVRVRKGALAPRGVSRTTAVRGAMWALWLGVAAAAAAALVGTRPWLQSGSVAASGFAGRAYPVRTIQHYAVPRSANRLVRVRCGGAARRVSSCWVSRSRRRHAQPAGRHS